MGRQRECKGRYREGAKGRYIAIFVDYIVSFEDPVRLWAGPTVISPNGKRRRGSSPSALAPSTTESKETTLETTLSESEGATVTFVWKEAEGGKA